MNNNEKIFSTKDKKEVTAVISKGRAQEERQKQGVSEVHVGRHGKTYSQG